MTRAASRRPLYATFVASLVLLAGCAEEPYTYIDVYADPIEPDGMRQKSGMCGDEADYESHIQLKSGSVTVTVSDAAGKATIFQYDVEATEKRTIEGEPGNWTVRVEWRGFDGALHAGIFC